MTCREIRARIPNRLSDFDYTTNRAYHITICAYQKHELFGEIKNGKIHLNELGEIVEQEIKKQEQVYEFLIVANYVVMPNHIHMLLKIRNSNKSLATIISQFKGIVTKRNKFNPWQDNYHDNIVRNADAFENISKYIDDNVRNWEIDPHNKNKST